MFSRTCILIYAAGTYSMPVAPDGRTAETLLSENSRLGGDQSEHHGRRFEDARVRNTGTEGEGALSHAGAEKTVWRRDLRSSRRTSRSSQAQEEGKGVPGRWN